MSIIVFGIYLLAIFLYFIPTYIAINRNVDGKVLIFALNLLFGWTFIVWVLLIIAALSVNNRNP